MLYFARAASFVVATLCAGVLLGTATPSFAQELSGSSLPVFNELVRASVPTSADASAALERLPSAVLQMVQDVPQTSEATAEIEEDYTSLASAVAAQDDALSDREIRCLAAGVYYESKGEPLAGQLAVAQTIINRTRSGRFPTSICSVLTQAGQFSFVRGGVVPSAEGRNGWTTAVAVAKVAQADLWDGAAESALYFHARRVAPGWRMQKVAAIGNHVFYR